MGEGPDEVAAGPSAPMLGWYHAQSPAELGWLAFGLGGQALFTLRFLVQWLHSERLGRSAIPPAFWYLSLLGGACVLAYGVHRRDPVIVLGQLPGVLVYTRNLVLIRRTRRRRHAVAGSRTSTS
jgi:lipid-A-disaccharide synthase-like uncharacterized protein